MPKLLWLLHRQNASPGFSQPLASFCPPPLLPPVFGSLCWGCFPRWLISSRGEAPHAVPPTVPSPVLGSGGSVNPDSLVSGLSSGSAVVAPLTLPLSGGVSRLGLLVRRLGRWGAHMGHHTTSGLWSEDEVQLFINAKELLAVQRGLLHFQSSLVGKTIAVFCDNTTAVAYLRREGGIRSPFLNSYRAGDPPLVRVARHLSGSTIYSGLSQYPGGHSVSPSPAASYRVVPQSGGVSIFVSSVASLDRLICHLRESPLFDLFLDPSFIAYPHGLPIVRYLDWFFGLLHQLACRGSLGSAPCVRELP